MLVLTAQKYSVIEGIFSDSYVPNFWMSNSMFLSPRHTNGYKMHLEKLEDKCSCDNLIGMYWCWVDNPYFNFYEKNYTKPLSERLLGCFVRVNDNDLVVSDYDLYTDYLEGRRDCNFFKSTEDIGTGRCLQGVISGIDKHSIVSIVDLDFLCALSGYSIDTIFDLSRRKNQLYDFSRGIDNFHLNSALFA